MKRWCLAFALLHAAAAARASVPDVKGLVVPRVSALTVSPTSVTGGAIVNGTVTLAQAAGPGGISVKLQSSNQAIAVTPENVVVQPGVNSATFIVQTNPLPVNPKVVANPPAVDISAQAGTSTRTVKLTVLPAMLSSIVFNPASVTGGNPATGQVTISGPAPPGGLAVGLAVVQTQSSQPAKRSAVALMNLQPALATVPSQVIVPAGATSATFQANTKGVSANTPMQINASNGVFVTKTATLTLIPPQVASISLSPTTDPVVGTSVTGTVTLTGPAPADGASIPLSLWPDCESCAACGPHPTIPSSASIQAEKTSGTFPVTTYAGSDGIYYIRAGEKWVKMFVRPPLIDLNNSLIIPQSVKGGTAVQGRLQLIGNVCGNSPYQLQSGNTNLARVPDHVIVPNGSSTGTFTITTSAVPSNQTVDISVMGDVGYGYAWVKKTLTLTP